MAETKKEATNTLQLNVKEVRVIESVVDVPLLHEDVYPRSECERKDQIECSAAGNTVGGATTTVKVKTSLCERTIRVDSRRVVYSQQGIMASSSRDGYFVLTIDNFRVNGPETANTFNFALRENGKVEIVTMRGKNKTAQGKDSITHALGTNLEDATTIESVVNSILARHVHMIDETAARNPQVFTFTDDLYAGRQNGFANDGGFYPNANPRFNNRFNYNSRFNGGGNFNQYGN